MPNAVILQAIVTILEELKGMDKQSVPAFVERDGSVLSLRDVMDVLVQHGILLAELGRGHRELTADALDRFNEIRMAHEQLRREFHEHWQEDRNQFERIERVLPDIISGEKEIPPAEVPKALPPPPTEEQDETKP